MSILTLPLQNKKSSILFSLITSILMSISFVTKADDSVGSIDKKSDKKITVNGNNIILEERSPYFNVTLGFSPFFGVIGFELQSNHHSISLGGPRTISYRYYDNPYGDSKFYGIFYSKWKNDEYDDYRDGIFFTDFETTYYGLGFGYRWQWRSGWNTSLSLAIADDKNRYSNSVGYIEETSVRIIPGANFGFKY